jgi:hypothetical protein
MMMMEIKKQSKVTKGTWLERSGETYNLHLDNKRSGLRINVHLWHDTNSYNVKLIEGDGRKKDFAEYFTLNNINPNELDKALNEAKEQAFMRDYYGN